MPCNLLLHCGSDEVPREELSRVHIPASTRSWQPIPHSLLLRQVESALPNYGMRVVSEAHGLSHDGNRYFGLLEVANGSNHPDYSRVPKVLQEYREPRHDAFWPRTLWSWFNACRMAT